MSGIVSRRWLAAVLGAALPAPALAQSISQGTPRIDVLYDAPPSMESYGGIPGASNPAANVAAIARWQTLSASLTYPPPLAFNSKLFTVDQPITFNNTKVNLKGGAPWRSNDSQNGGLVSTVTTGTAFTFTGYAPILEDMVLAGPGRSSGLTLVAYFTRAGGTGGDVDAVLRGCLIQGAADGIRIKGRGLQVDNCAFTDVQKAIRLGMMETADLATPTEYYNTIEGGARAYVIRTCRFHAVTVNSVWANDENAEYLHGILAEGNYQDGPATFFHGYLNHSLLGSNTIIRCHRDGVVILGAKSSLIDLNLSGDVMSIAEFAILYPSLPAPEYATSFIDFQGDTSDLTVRGNWAFNDDHAFRFGSGTHKGLKLHPNLYRPLMANDTATKHIVRVEAGTIVDGLDFTGARAVIDTMTNNPSAAWLSNAGTVSNLQFEDNYDNGALGVRIAGPITYRDEVAWTPTVGFDTAGDYAAVYISQVGRRWALPNGRVKVKGSAVWTHTYTTAGGSFRVNLPDTVRSTQGNYPLLVSVFGNIDTTAGKPQVAGSAVSGTTYARLIMSGDATTIALVTTTNLPSGATEYTLDFEGEYSI